MLPTIHLDYQSILAAEEIDDVRSDPVLSLESEVEQATVA